MKTKEIRKLIDVPAFFAAIEKMVTEYQCTYIDALEEYAYRNDLTLEFVASVVKTNKGAVPDALLSQCRQLNLVD